MSVAPDFFADLGETLADVEEQRFAGFVDEPGNYAAKVSEFMDAFKNDDPNQPQLIIVYEITEGKYKGTTVRDYFSYTRDRSATTADGESLFERQLGYIKARFVDLGLPVDHKGPINKESFIGVEVILTMTYARPSKRPGADPNSHINSNTGKPYVNISKVTQRSKADLEKAAPTVPDAPKNDSFFS